MQSTGENEKHLQELFKLEKVNTRSLTEVNLKCLVFNVQSICNKCDAVMEQVIDYDTDVMLLSETWLKSNRNSVTATVESYCYKLHHNTRKGRAKELGGGVGILVKKCLEVKPIKVTQFQS